MKIEKEFEWMKELIPMILDTLASSEMKKIKINWTSNKIKKDFMIGPIICIYQATLSEA